MLNKLKNKIAKGDKKEDVKEKKVPSKNVILKSSDVPLSEKKDSIDSLDSLESLEELSLESLDDDMQYISLDSDNISLEDATGRKNNEIEDFEFKNVNNKRREHLSAKEDYLQRKKEAQQSKAKRKLINGLLASVLSIFFLLGILTAFPDEVTSLTSKASESVSVFLGGVFNKDIQKRIERDFGKFGIKFPKDSSENLKDSNVLNLKSNGIALVEGIPMKFTEKNKGNFTKNFKKGSYLVGNNLPEGIYYGKNTKLTIFNKVDHVLKNKNGKEIVLKKEYLELKKGQIIIVSKVGGFVPQEYKEEKFIDLKDIVENKEYLVGKDLPAGDYVLKSTSSRGRINVTDTNKILDNILVQGSGEVSLSKGDFVSFEKIDTIEKIQNK